MSFYRSVAGEIREQFVRWASGVVGMALAIWGGQVLSRGMSRRRWQMTHEAGR